MYKLAPYGQYTGANIELGKISPYSTIYELETGGKFPWLGNSSTGSGVKSTPNKLAMFGRKKSTKKSTKKKIGYTIKKGRVVQVYKIIGLVGNRYYDKKKLTKGKKVYKTKAKAQAQAKKAKKTTKTKKAKKTTKTKRVKKTTKTKRLIGYTVNNGRAVTVYKISGLVGKRYSNRVKISDRKRVFKTKAQALRNQQQTLSRQRSREKALRARRRRRRRNGRAKALKLEKRLRRKNRKKRRRRRRRQKRDKYYYYYVDEQSLTGRRRNSDTGYLKGSSCSRRTNSADCSSNPNCKWERNYCRKKYGGQYQGPLNKQGFGSDMINPSSRFNYTMNQYALNSATPSLTRLEEIAGFPTYPTPLSTQMKNYNSYNSVRNFSGMGF